MDTKPTVDGITTAPAAPQPPVTGQVPAVSPQERRKAVTFLLLVFGLPYIAYLGWCLFLMSVLPDREGTYESWIPMGTASGFIGVIVLLSVGVLAVMRILQQGKRLPSFTVAMSAIRVVAVLLPGLVLGVLMPMTIAAEPKLWMTVADPADTSELIAPLAVTLSVEDAMDVLRRRNVRPIAYQWDFDGDGQVNEETVLPEATAYYSRMGLKEIAVSVETSDGKPRVIRLKLPIQKEVFEVTPIVPIVDEPAKFSVAHLVDLPEDIQEVRWDFNSDGEIDQVSNALDVVNTFVRPGTVKVSATLIFRNQTQQKHEREILVKEPEPLPFDIRIVSEPEILVSPPPFQTIFRVETEEPLRAVSWNFGREDEILEGERVGYTFEQKGNFVVTAEAKSTSGDVAKLSTIVRVVDELEIPDLSFSGSPEVDMKTGSIKGEVPLTVNLTPRSSLPLVTYTWEAPEATSVGSTETTLQAIYRRPDTYTVILLAQDASGRAMRMPIRIEVEPPSTLIAIKMNPEGGVAPLDVTFDASETRIPNETVGGFEWLFGEEGEGGMPKPGSAVMRYTYTKPGTYAIKLLARTIEGNVYDATRTIVVRAPLLDACFTASRVRGTAPLGVKFTMDCTTGTPTGMEWDFGDGAKTDEKDPIHVFEDPGTYTVELTLRDASGNTSSKKLEITADAE